MTIGELLKEYRITQGKNQKEFTDSGMIVSQSYYSKVEKNIHRITADSLIELLHYNNIPLDEFFGRINQNDKIQHQQVKDFNNMLVDAYYDSDVNKIKQIKELVIQSNLPDKDKKEELFWVDAWLEVLKGPKDTPNTELREKVKDKIFNLPNFNKSNVALFCNFMQFYDLDSNKIIGRRIVEQYINSKDIKMQIALIAIIVNIIVFSLKEKRENEVSFFIESAEKIKTRPELVFYKIALYFFENIVNYHLTKNEKYYQRSVAAKDLLINIDMTQYGKVLEKLLITY
ncbi:helix-turn-helix domain-containing protein, partial [Lactobacillus helveticus]